MSNQEDSEIISFTTICERDGDSCRLVEEDTPPAFDFTDRYGCCLEEGVVYEVIVKKFIQKDFKVIVLNQI